MDDTRQQGKGGRKNEMTGGGPTLVKHRAAEKGGAARAPWRLDRGRRKAAYGIPDPPPPLKGRKAGGGGGGGPEWSSSPLIQAR
jgi:hypothetical protein